MKAKKKLWGGRFTKQTAASVESFTESVPLTGGSINTILKGVLPTQRCLPSASSYRKRKKDYDW